MSHATTYTTMTISTCSRDVAALPSPQDGDTVLQFDTQRT